MSGDLESRLAAGPATMAEAEAYQRRLAAVDALHTAYGFPVAFAVLVPDLLAAAAGEGTLFERLDRVADECRHYAEALRPIQFTDDRVPPEDADDLPF